MSKIVLLDTHVLVWLYTGEIDKISNKAKKSIEEYSLLVSPASILELEFLYEIKRISKKSNQIITALQNDIGLEIEDVSARSLFLSAIKESWTRDPFDRMLVAHASINNHSLISKDRNIHSNFKLTIW